MIGTGIRVEFGTRGCQCVRAIGDSYHQYCDNTGYESGIVGGYAIGGENGNGGLCSVCVCGVLLSVGMALL